MTLEEVEEFLNEILNQLCEAELERANKDLEEWDHLLRILSHKSTTFTMMRYNKDAIQQGCLKSDYVN